MYFYFINSSCIDENVLIKRGNWKKYDIKNKTKVDFLFIERSISIENLNNFYDLNIGIENQITFEISDMNKYSFLQKFLQIPNQKKNMYQNK